MKKGLILILGIIAVALKGEAQNNEPKIVKIEIIGRPTLLRDGALIYPSTGGNVGLRSFNDLGGTFWFTSFYETSYKPRDVGLGPHYEVGKNIVIPNYVDLGKKFSVAARWHYGGTYKFTLTNNTLQLVLTRGTYEKILNAETYSFELTSLNEFVLVLMATPSSLHIHKIIPYDGKEYQRYRNITDLIFAGDQRIINGLGGLRAYASYLLGPGDSSERRKEFERKIREQSTLSPEELNRWLLDSE